MRRSPTATPQAGRGWSQPYTASRYARRPLRSELLLPFPHAAATVRLPSTARRTCPPRCAAVGVLCHAGSTAALLAATTALLFRLRRRSPTLLRATAALLVRTPLPLRLRRSRVTLLGATTALLRAQTPALFRPRRRPATLFGAATALARGRGPALFGAASTL